MAAKASPLTMYTGLTDEELVLACRRGEESAWEALVGRYQRLVYSIPYRAGLRDDLAGDVFGHVFVSLVEHLDRIEQPSRIGTWLVTTAKRETWRVSKANRVGQPAVGHGDPHEVDFTASLPDSSLLPEEELLRLEEQHRVRTAVSGLDDRCRSLLTMLFYDPEPPPYTTIASIMGTTEGSIGPTRARCLQKLRKLLEVPGA